MVSRTNHPRTFADHDVVAYRGLVRLGRMKQKQIADAHGVQLSAAQAMLTGKSYRELPGALTVHQLRYPDYFGDAVPRLRREYRAGRLSKAKIIRSFGLKTCRPAMSDVVAMLTGRSYADVPDALTPDEVKGARGLITPEVALFMRLAFNPPKVSRETLAKAYRLKEDFVHSVLKGDAYKDVPGAVPEILAQDRGKFTDQEVLEIRRRFVAAQPDLTQKALAAELGIAERTLREMLVGNTYAHVPEPVSPALLAASATSRRRQFLPEVVLFMRLQYRPGVVSTLKLAKHYGTEDSLVHAILTGASYADIPGIVEEFAAPGLPRLKTTEEVIGYRRRFRDTDITMAALAREGNVSQRTMERIVYGYSYKDVPEAVTEKIVKDHAILRYSQTTWPLEVALFMRLQYDPERGVNVDTLVNAYGGTRKKVVDVLRGVTYQPAAADTRPLEPIIKSTRERKLTVEQVIAARRWIYRGEKTYAEIARLYRLNENPVKDMVSGKTYSEIPGAVKETIKQIIQRARKRKPIKMRPLRLRDHDATLPRHQRMMAAE